MTMRTGNLGTNSGVSVNMSSQKTRRPATWMLFLALLAGLGLVAACGLGGAYERESQQQDAAASAKKYRDLKKQQLRRRLLTRRTFAPAEDGSCPYNYGRTACPICNGSGLSADHKSGACAKCGGTGRICAPAGVLKRLAQQEALIDQEYQTDLQGVWDRYNRSYSRPVAVEQIEQRRQELERARQNMSNEALDGF